jgi:hypothetical protein
LGVAVFFGSFSSAVRRNEQLFWLFLQKSIFLAEQKENEDWGDRGDPPPAEWQNLQKQWQNLQNLHLQAKKACKFRRFCLYL